MILVPIDRVTIHVHASRQTIRLDPPAKYIECRLGGLRRIKPRESPVGCIINDHHQHALGAAALEPLVMAPVHLHHRSEAGSALASSPVLASTTATLPQPALFEQTHQRVG